MWKAAILAMALTGAGGQAASAQELVSYRPDSCQKFTATRSDREALYVRAACVAARAGVASPANGSLSREEVLSILMLMSLRQANPAHNS